MSLKAITQGVTAINSQSGVVTLESTDGSVLITEPVSGVINLQSTGGGSPVWGSITGTITNQVDLVNYVMVQALVFG